MCTPLVLWESIFCNARPGSIHHSSHFAASSPQQLVFPHSSCSAVLQVTCRRAALVGGKRLSLAWPGKTAGPGDSGAGGGCCQCSPPPPTHFHIQFIQAGRMQWSKIRFRTSGPFHDFGLWGFVGFFGCFVVGFFLSTLDFPNCKTKAGFE